MAAVTTLKIHNFHFASKCSATGTTVKATIRVGPKHGFSFHNATTGIAVSGSLHGKNLANAVGIAQVHTTTCDSGPLMFTAKAS
jgi:hypothetical protein